MPLSLEGKVALVTGASAGLGACVAEQLAAEGCDVVVNYARSEAKAAALVEELTTKYGVRAIKLQGDVTKVAISQQLVADTVKQFGRLDVVVSNVGWTRFIDFADLDEVTEDDFDQCMSANVKSHFFLFRAAKPHFERNPDGGSFLISASIAGLKPSGSSIPYSASKAALVHLTKCLARAHGPKARVNAVCPGLLLTEWGLKFGPEKIAAMESSLPLKQTCSVEDTAAAFVSLAKSTSQTGAIITVDGGLNLV